MYKLSMARWKQTMGIQRLEGPLVTGSLFQAFCCSLYVIIAGSQSFYCASYKYLAGCLCNGLSEGHQLIFTRS